MIGKEEGVVVMCKWGKEEMGGISIEYNLQA